MVIEPKKEIRKDIEDKIVQEEERDRLKDIKDPMAPAEGEIQSAAEKESMILESPPHRLKQVKDKIVQESEQ